jgi:uncharacterized delta-60 repeat protein
MELITSSVKRGIMRRKFCKFFPAPLLLLVIAAAAAFPQQLDPTFGTGGGVSLISYPYGPSAYSGSGSYGTRGFLRPDGGISIFGTQRIGFIKSPEMRRNRVVTYTADGANTGIGDPQHLLFAADAAQQPDGKIVAAGSTDVENYTSGYRRGDWFIERFDLNRALDPSFGINGVLTLDFGTNLDIAKNIAVQNDGKILVSGSTSSGGSPITIVARLNQNGTPDTSFGPNGSGYVLLFDNGALSQKMVLKPNGSILLLGMYFDNPPLLNETITMLFQLNPDGSPDPAFGDHGLAYIFDPEQLTLADAKARPTGETFILSTRKYVPDGTRYFKEQDIVLTEVNGDGSRDQIFGQNGQVVENLSPPTATYTSSYSLSGGESANAILIESTGNVVIAATAYGLGPSRSVQSTCCGAYVGRVSAREILFLLRYNAAGHLIAKNYTRQTPRLQYVHGIEEINGMLEQPDNKIVVYGALYPAYFDPASVPPATSSPPKILLARFSSISAVNNANSFYDYNMNGMADFATYAVVPGQYSKWLIARSSYNPAYVELALDFGLEGDTPVPGDYDGDSVPDLAVFRNSTGDWFTRKFYLDNCGPMDCTEQIHFGSPGDVPAPGDFDGDGKTDRAVFRPSEGNWYILFSSGGWTGLHFGQNGDLPVTGDYDDDGKADVAVIRRENGLTTWFILQSSNNQFLGIQFGLDSDKTAQADFNGDGETDIAVFRPSEGNWYILSNYSDLSYKHWGQVGDIPEPADYDGDGNDDVAVFRPSQRVHYALPSHDTNPIGINVSGPAEVPIPGAYVR